MGIYVLIQIEYQLLLSSLQSNNGYFHKSGCQRETFSKLEVNLPKTSEIWRVWLSTEIIRKLEKFCRQKESLKKNTWFIRF